MARPKIARKSTTVDMTAMCDVAFLLLAFFILTTKFKPSEAVPITTPHSVASKIAPEKDVVMISINHDGKVFLSTGDGTSDKDAKEQMIRSLNGSHNLGLSENDIKVLRNAPFIGVPLAGLKQQAQMQTSQMNANTLPGIPCKDSTNNELMYWMSAVHDAYSGRNVNILLKGDNLAKYPTFKNVITAFKKNDFLKFQMVTSPEAVPQGTDLYRMNMQKKAV